MKAEYVREVGQTLPIQRIVHFLEKKYFVKVYQNGNEFWAFIDGSLRLVALLEWPNLIMPAVSGMGVVKIPVHKIPEYKKKFFNLYFCQTCMEKRGEGLYRNSFISTKCPSGHTWRFITSTFTWVEVRQRQPPKQETTTDPEVQFALQDIKEAIDFRRIYGKYLRMKAKEEARREAIRKELQILSKQGAEQSQREQPRQQVPNFNFQITYIDKEGIEHHLSPGQILELCRRLGVDVPAPPLQTVDQVVKEFRADHDFIPVSIGDDYETRFPLKSLKVEKPRQTAKQPKHVDTGRKLVPWRVERKTKTIRQQSPQPLSLDALRTQQRELSKEEFQKKYRLVDVTELQGGAVKGRMHVSYNRSIVTLAVYSFLFPPSGRSIGEFSTEQVALATHLANEMGGQVIVSEDKKYNNISLCVLLKDATVVVARRREQ